MVPLEGIKNIIFDLGGVIINLKPEATIDAFKSIFKNQFVQLEQELQSENILNKLEIGEITPNEFIRFFQSYQTVISSEEIIKSWNAMLLDIPKERIDVINKLAKRYRIFLLSNTNQFHLNFIDDYVKVNFNLSDMAAPFEKAYYSHQIGLRKPDAQIFKLIMAKNNLLPKETLFIDDSEQHIITAKQLGIQTHYLDLKKEETLLDLF